MKTLRILSWNVNGIRAVANKGFAHWLAAEDPDILCLQETKALPDQIPAELAPQNYHSYFCPAQRKGYSGVAVYSKIKPAQVKTSLGLEKFDTEGRLLQLDFGRFVLFNVYFPNGKASPERLAFKMEFYDTFLRHVEKVRKKNPHLVICGDVNTAHREIDLARPKENEKISGFLPQERAWIDTLLDTGYLDTFRQFDSSPGRYSWWDYKTRARARNIGWRIDYFFVSSELRKNLKSAFLLPDVPGSDHCPVGIELQFK